MSEHRVGDLGYYRGKLGYITRIERIAKDANRYFVSWFHESGEEDISAEFEDTMAGLKRNLRRYMNSKAHAEQADE